MQLAAPPSDGVAPRASGIRPTRRAGPGGRRAHFGGVMPVAMTRSAAEQASRSALWSWYSSDS